MFNHLRSKKKLFLFIFACAILSASTSYADTNKQTIGTDAAPNISSTTAKFTGASLNVTGTGEQSDIIVNDITINYNGSLTNGLRTTETIGMENNVMLMSGGERSLSGDNSAAKLTINNNTNSTNADLSSFNLDLKDNSVTMNAKLSNSSGNIYGAVLESNNSGVGNARVMGNVISIGSAADIKGVPPKTTGGLMKINTTTNNISSNAVVSNNIIDATGASSTNEWVGQMIGGQFTFDVQEQSTHKNYNINADVNGNKILLNNATFYGTMTGGLLETQTDAEYKTLTLNGDVQNNEITISGGKYEGSTFIGGHLSLAGSGLGEGSSAAVDVHDNKITISGGQFTDGIFVGGMTTRNVQYTLEPTGNVTGNTIEISGDTKFKGNTYFFGGYSTGDNTISGNTLSIKVKDIQANGVDYFDTYKFDVSGATNGDTFLSVKYGNGHNNNLFSQYESYVKNSALDLTGTTFTWKDTSLPEDGRPAALGIGGSINLLSGTSGYITGTIANNGAEDGVVAADGNTYYYKVLQVGNNVELLHNGLDVAADWNDNISMSAGNNAGEDVYMHVDSGTIKADTISVTSTGAASAQLTAQTLDVTAQNTTLNLTGTTGDKVKFTTINVGDGKTLSKAGDGFYGFTTMNITGSGVVDSLDAMGGGAANVTTGTSNTFNQINVGAGSTLTITGTYDFNTLGVHGDTNTFTGNLNAAGKDLNFYLADTTVAGATALNVSGTADITDSNVKVGVTGSSSALQKADQVVLLDAGTLTGAPVSTTGVGMQGLFLTYDFDLETVGNQLIATVTKAGLTQESKAFAEGRVASIGLISQGADFIAQTGITSAANAALQQHSLAMFTAFGGGKTRLDSGSHVDMNAFNALVGLSREVSIFKADFVVGSFIEYGRGSYNSYNDFPSGKVKGSGDTDYTGLGALARWYGQDGSYVEGVLHTGVTDTDFSGAVFFADKKAKYDFDTWYYGGHFGVGHVWNVLADVEDIEDEDAIQIDGSVKFFINHQESKEVHVSSGDELMFHESNSKRLRAGLKANFFASRAWRPYIGAAYDHEFDGKAEASTYNMRIDAPTIKGNTGVGEVGLSYVTQGFTLGLGAEGYIGVRRGWSGNVKLGFAF